MGRGKEESLGREGKRGKGRMEKGKGREGQGRNGGGGMVAPQAKACPPPELFSWRPRWIIILILILYLFI